MKCPVCGQKMRKVMVRFPDGLVWTGLWHCDNTSVSHDPLYDTEPIVLCGASKPSYFARPAEGAPK